ncbi:MAG TPA: hypothetical protein VGV89_01575 [Thermoplasmata archaeon]|nr:hypothetical protein [Thermoplasmata archaeon]
MVTLLALVVPTALGNPPCSPIACHYNGSGQLPAPTGIKAGNITTSTVTLTWTSYSTYNQGYWLTNESVFFWTGSPITAQGYCLASPGFGHQVINATLLFSVPGIAAPQPPTYPLSWNFTALQASTSYCVEINEWNGPAYGNYSRGLVFATASPSSGGLLGGAGSGGLNSSNVGGLFIPGAGGLSAGYAVITYSVIILVLSAVVLSILMHRHHGRGSN